jgi:hypothetical protein
MDLSKLGRRKIDSESKYSYGSEDELDNLIHYRKEVEASSAKNSNTNQNSLPNLIIYATLEGWTVRLEKLGLNN